MTLFIFLIEARTGFYEFHAVLLLVKKGEGVMNSYQLLCLEP